MAHQRRLRLIAIKHTVATATAAEIAVKSSGVGDAGAVVTGVGWVGEGMGVVGIPIIYRKMLCQRGLSP